MALFACNGSSSKGDYLLLDDMSSVEVFEALKDSNSFSVECGQDEYRFNKYEGYTIYENGQYDAKFVEDKKVYTISRTKEGFMSVTVEDYTKEHADLFYDIYLNNIENVKGTYATVSTEDEGVLNVEVLNGECIVKTLYPQKQGAYSIKECRIYDVNNTILLIPKAVENYKQIAKEVKPQA